MKRRATLPVVCGLALLALASSGCDTSSGGPYAGGWYDAFGNLCGSGMPTPGCDYYWGGAKVNEFEDPFYTGQDPSGWWQSPDGVIYSGGVAINDAGQTDSRDLIGDVAAREQDLVTRAGKDFAARYALTEDVGIRIARTLHDWASLSETGRRSRTDQDVADFSLRLYGVGADRAASALSAAKNGDVSGLIRLNEEIATYWAASPETSQAILKNWYRDQFSGFNVH